MVTSAEDLLDELFGVEHRPERSRRSPPARRGARSTPSILDAVEADLDIDGICAAAGLPVRETRAALTRLEAAGQVRRDALGGYRRTASGSRGLSLYARGSWNAPRTHGPIGIGPNIAALWLRPASSPSPARIPGAVRAFRPTSRRLRAAARTG